MNTSKKQKGLARFSILSVFLSLGLLSMHTSVVASSDAKQAGEIVSSDEIKQSTSQSTPFEIPLNFIRRNSNSNQETITPAENIPRLLVPMGPVKDTPKIDVEQNTPSSAKEIPTNFVHPIEQKENITEDIPREVPRSKRHPVNIYDIQEKPVIKKEAAENITTVFETKEKKAGTSSMSGAQKSQIQTKSKSSKVNSFFKRFFELFS